MVLLMEPCLSGVSHLFGDRFMYLMVQAYLKAYIIITIKPYLVYVLIHYFMR